MSLTFDSATALSIDAAIRAASYGSKIAAGLAAIQESIGANYRVLAWHNQVMVYMHQFTGQLPISGSQIVIPGPAHESTPTADFLSTGFVRVESADGSRHAQGTLGFSGTDFHISAAMSSADGAEIGSLTLGFDPSIDVQDAVTTAHAEVVSDMLAANDAQAFGVTGFEDSWNAPPTEPIAGAVVMGTKQKGSVNRPSFTSNAAIHANFRGSAPWYFGQPWIVLYEENSSTGSSSLHTAQNAAVKVWNQRVLLRQKDSGAWVTWNTGQGSTWLKVDRSTKSRIGSATVRLGAAGGIEVRAPSGPLPYALRGHWPALSGLNMSEYDAILHTCWAKIVKWSSTGVDAGEAKLLMQVGFDWYPTQRAHQDLDSAPGAMYSRLKRVGASAQRFSALTLLDARQENVESSGIASTLFLSEAPALL